MDDKSKHETIGLPLIMKSFSIFIVFIAVTFITAGRLDYWQGWIFNGLNIFFLLITYIVLRNRKDLIKERLQPGKGMKRWDRVYYTVSTPIFFAMLILSVLDAGRFHWKPTISFLLIIIGILMYSIGQIIVLWAKKANAYFSSVVRIQSERKQTVCSNGPYRYVRHPGYVGGFIQTIATPFVLGSFWGLLPAGIIIVMILCRTYLEDTTLKAELTGYTNYTKKVRYRLVPFIW